MIANAICDPMAEEPKRWSLSAVLKKFLCVSFGRYQDKLLRIHFVELLHKHSHPHEHIAPEIETLTGVDVVQDVPE